MWLNYNVQIVVIAVTNEIEPIEIERTKSNKRTNERMTAVTCQLKFNIRLCMQTLRH